MLSNFSGSREESAIKNVLIQISIFTLLCFNVRFFAILNECTGAMMYMKVLGNKGSKSMFSLHLTGMYLALLMDYKIHYVHISSYNHTMKQLSIFL